MHQLEREFLQADVAQVRAMMEACAEGDDPLGQYQYEQRLRRLESQLADFPQMITRQPASVALLFGGVPVVGTAGIQARFATHAVQQFQKIITQRYTTQADGMLASRGRVPLSEESHLLVTNIARGSFGFVLQSFNASDDNDQSLKLVLDDVAVTLAALAEGSDRSIDEVISEVDDRQLATLKDFIKLLDDEGATLRLVEGEREVELNRSAVGRARALLEALEISDQEKDLEGIIIGWTQYSQQFEFLPRGDLPVVIGKVDQELMEAVKGKGLNPLNKAFRATLKIKEVRTKGRSPGLSYQLRALQEL